VDLAALEVLVAVSEERGFSRAAERLGRTQPAVSQAVRRLEEEVGARLVDRSSKDATLTPAGTLLCGHARQLLKLRHEAEAALQDLRRLRRGRVAVAANEYTVVHLFPILAAFRRLHPEVEVEVRRSPASEIPSEVLGRDVELGVLTYRPVEPGLAAVQIASDELALVVAPGHPLAGRKRVSIRRLGDEAFLAHNVRSPYRERVLKAFERHRTPLRIVMELPSLDAIKRLAGEGLGVALVPRRAAEGEIARGELAALTVPEMRFRRPVNLVHRTAVELSHAATAFVAAARATR
jgi:DNA-binding transcriptional LysR family regulator